MFIFVFCEKPSRSKIKECWISSNLENVQYCAQTFSFCSLFVGQQKAAMNFSFSKDSTNRSNDVGNLSIFAGIFEKKLLIKEIKQALKAFKLHLSKGHKNKRSMTFEQVEVWPVQLSLFYWFWRKQYSFHLILPDFCLKIGREKTIRVLNGRFLFSDDWLLHASLHSGWSTHTIGDILWQVARFLFSVSSTQGIKYTRCQVQGIKYKVSSTHKESCTQGIKYKASTTKYQDGLDPRLEENMTTFPLQLRRCT